MKTKILADLKICSSVRLTFNAVTSLTKLIKFFVLILLHAVSKNVRLAIYTECIFLPGISFTC